MKSSSGAEILRTLAMAMLSALAVSSGAFAGSDEEAIARIEHDFAAMQITRDPATIESVAAIMDDGFRFSDPAARDSGASKAELLGLLKSDKLVIQSMDFRPFTIRIFGSTAIVEGVNSGHASFAGKDVSGTFVWVDVFEKRGGRWIWLFSQSGKVGDPLSDKDLCSRAPCPAAHPGFSVSR